MNIVFIYPNIGSSGGVPKVQLLKASYLIDYYKYKVTIVCDKASNGTFFTNLFNKIY